MPNQFYDSIRSIFFSPTGTSKKIAEAITRGVPAPTDEPPLALPVQPLDLTHTAGPETTLSAETVAVIAAPVYGGRIAPVAMKRLAGIRGSGGPAVLVAL